MKCAITCVISNREPSVHRAFADKLDDRAFLGTRWSGQTMLKARAPLPYFGPKVYPIDVMNTVSIFLTLSTG